MLVSEETLMRVKICALFGYDLTKKNTVHALAADALGRVASETGSMEDIPSDELFARFLLREMTGAGAA